MSFIRLKLPPSFIKRDLFSSKWLKSITTGNPSLNEVNEAPKDDQKYRREHPISVCLEYMESKAYNTTYGDKPVWNLYIRNFKGGLPPKTRKTCVSPNGKIITGSPCPICRDEYLMPHYENIKLLKQFISPFGGEILDTRKTGICQKQQFNLLVAIKKAQNFGLLKFPIPHRSYDYSVYCKK